MRNIFSITVLLGIAATTPFTIFAQTVENRLTDSTGTYSFAVPAGWKSNADAEGFAVVNPEKTVALAIKAHNYDNFAAFAADANLERDGLELVGKPLEITGGTAFRTMKKTPNGTIYIGTCVLFSPHGGGMIIVALSNEVNAATALETGWNLSQSVLFSKLRQNVVTGQSQSPLSGKHLLYLYTGNGYSERKDIYLCASGGFYQSTNLGGFTPNDSAGGSFGSLASKHGTWTISGDGAKLSLAFQNGRTAEYRITKRQASNEIGLNGNRFFVQSQDKCR
ncbi:MAG: hypothetical protein H7070_16920 [Saprospiraceae bacterium]|nr:hypothetical protein [Pyrinomonadaceae bacterium]